MGLRGCGGRSSVFNLILDIFNSSLRQVENDSSRRKLKRKLEEWVEGFLPHDALQNMANSPRSYTTSSVVITRLRGPLYARHCAFQHKLNKGERVESQGPLLFETL